MHLDLNTDMYCNMNDLNKIRAVVQLNPVVKSKLG